MRLVKESKLISLNLFFRCSETTGINLLLVNTIGVP